jgi:hypothetical protein
MAVDRQIAARRRRRQMADLRRPAVGTARRGAARQDAFLSVSKVASNPTDGAPGIGQFRSYDRPESRHANDRFQSTAAIGQPLLEAARSPKQPLTVLLRWSASDAGRTSGV